MEKRKQKTGSRTQQKKTGLCRIAQRDKFWKTSYRGERLLFHYSGVTSSLGVSRISQKDSRRIFSYTSIWPRPRRTVPIRITRTADAILFYYISGGRIYFIRISIEQITDASKKPDQDKCLLQRVIENPIIEPSAMNRWESCAVFNAGAIYLENKVHLVYRAIGESGLSVFGYASSDDGIRISERTSEPAYVCEKIDMHNQPEPYPYASGGSWCGCEDPRLTQVDDTIYMTYTAFDGCRPPCVAVTSISKEDFLRKEWNWKKPEVISRPGQVNKNWVVFPEKIKGKFAILHSITPVISIAYVDSLNFTRGRFIDSTYRSAGREEYWDNWVRGAGPPPIRTREGWLVLYHAMDKRDPDRYKIGAMVLDENDPGKILYRSDSPLLEPDHWYENDGHKKGVVYTCGAAVIGNTLFVYYGGSDNFICAATVDIDTLLKQLKNSAVRQPGLSSSAA